MLIDISTLRAATGDFAEINKLGEGGFGAVYKVLAEKIYILEKIGEYIEISIPRLNVGSVLHRVFYRMVKK